jgi:hypothetical protein
MPRTTSIIDGLLGVFKSLKDPKESPEQSDYHSNDSNIPFNFDVPDAILAFRTITTMLSLIPSTKTTTGQAKTTTGQEDCQYPREQRTELRVLDALSAVIVREHEIVAVMAKPYDGIKIQVIASVNNSEPALSITQHGQSTPSRRLLQWLTTPNPRDLARNLKDSSDSQTRTTQNTSTIIVDPKMAISEELSGAKESDLLNTFLQTQWWVFWQFLTI